MEYYSAIKNSEILPFVMVWIQLECITLSEISQSEKDKYYMISLLWNSRKKTDKHMRRHRERERDK